MAPSESSAARAPAANAAPGPGTNASSAAAFSSVRNPPSSEPALTQKQKRRISRKKKILLTRALNRELEQMEAICFQAFGKVEKRLHALDYFTQKSDADGTSSRKTILKEIQHYQRSIEKAAETSKKVSKMTKTVRERAALLMDMVPGVDISDQEVEQMSAEVFDMIRTSRENAKLLIHLDYEAEKDDDERD